MISSKLSVDPRIVTNLVCAVEDGLSRFPRDTLHRVSITLDFLSELISNYRGDSDLFESENGRFALSLQLSGIAALLDSLGDSLQIRTPTRGENEIAMRFSHEELEKLTILACRQEQSIERIILSIISDALKEFDPGKRRNKASK